MSYHTYMETGRETLRKAAGITQTDSGTGPRFHLKSETVQELLHRPELSRNVYSELGQTLWANRVIKDERNKS